MLGEYISPMLVAEIKNAHLRLFNFLKEEVAVQPKFDGIRMQAHKFRNDIWLFSRSGILCNDKFPEIVDGLRKYQHDFILDCEAVSFKDGKIDFANVNKKFHSGEGTAVLVAFDILHLDGIDLHENGYYNRLKHLFMIEHSNVLMQCPTKIIHDPKKLREYYADYLKQGYEGIIVRELTKPYMCKRDIAVQKIKPMRSMDVMIEDIELGKKGFFSYVVKTKEGTIAKIPTRAVLEKGQIVEMRHEGFIDSDKYPLGFTVRFPTLFRVRFDLKEPQSVEGVR